MKKVFIGQVGVDSGQIMIADPQYIDSQWKAPVKSSYEDHGHDIFRHTGDKSLWQYTYGRKPQGGVTMFPGTYADIIPEYGKCPNDLIREGILEKTNIDPTPHIPNGEFSYRGACKATRNEEKHGGQLNYTMGHAGAGVSVQSGIGDGTYNVYAEMVNIEHCGTRIRRVTVDFFEGQLEDPKVTADQLIDWLKTNAPVPTKVVATILLMLNDEGAREQIRSQIFKSAFTFPG